MKRSEINQVMREAVKFCRKQKFFLPKFAYWKIEEWQDKGQEIREIVENQLGWDISDFGSGNFHNKGLLMFTIRNGNFEDTSKYSKTYCEKMLIVEEEQVTPMHHHYSKKEDIINRGGGTLQIEIYKTNGEDELLQEAVDISLDGVRKTFEAGSIIELEPGDSIYLPPNIYHKFWGKKGSGKILVGEVSTVNDDYIDNKFYEEVKRFSNIEEDEQPLYLLYDDYDNYLKFLD
ncbi:MAG: D-lyxose/D-mannose family sugar isomerase [Candidatus Lokiarchaeota archaeon]|nr:D-lyxose/D-mannose family sugar isomerase [Candidatus Lokiarchaeota archaeon]MBD3338839.1 D-lyxose/D-mannose family sugar isomerase [Candidatus Lokiarchaeota archaeon]